MHQLYWSPDIHIEKQQNVGIKGEKIVLKEKQHNWNKKGLLYVYRMHTFCSVINQKISQKIPLLKGINLKTALFLDSVLKTFSDCPITFNLYSVQ